MTTADKIKKTTAPFSVTRWELCFHYSIRGHWGFAMHHDGSVSVMAGSFQFIDGSTLDTRVYL